MYHKATTVTIKPKYVKLEQLTADPTLAAGRVWFRSDTQTLKFTSDGVNVVEIPISRELTTWFRDYLAYNEAISPPKGLFSMARRIYEDGSVVADGRWPTTQYYSTNDTTWYSLSKPQNCWFISDGANVRVINDQAANIDYALAIRRYLLKPEV